MKILNHIAGVTFATVALTTAQLARAQIPPSITTQPQSQTNDYGSDVTLTVSADGAEPLYYQWRKSWRNLSDYENIAGAHSSTLHIIGAANSDEGEYRVIVSNAVGSVTSAPVALRVSPTQIFADTFEAGLANWHPLLDATSMELDTNQNHTPGGSWSAGLTNSSQAMYHNLGQKLSGRARLTGWIYDTGSNQMACLRILGYEGVVGYAKYATGKALVQSLAIGIGRAGGAINGAMLGEELDATTYQAWIFRGTNRGWFNLDAPEAPRRSMGWHQFVIDRRNDGSVEFSVDGVTGRRITGVKQEDLDSVIMGSGGLGKNDDLAEVPVTAWFDDVNVEYFTPKFDFTEYSSSGSVFPDWMVLREVGTNAAATNTTQVRTVSEVEGGAPSASLGDWITNGSDIYAKGIRGWLEYTVTAPQNDAYRIEVEGRERNNQWPPVEMPLRIWIDGEYLGGLLDLSYGPQNNGFVRCFSPYILAGPHTIRVLWDNAHPRRSLDIRAVRLQSVDSSSVEASGMKTWVANRLKAQSGIEVGPPDSLTSPACIEGRGQFLSMMSVAAGDPLTPTPVCHGAGYRWYANVPLLTEQPTPVVVSYQNGGLAESNTITWQPLNLLQGGSVMIRQGDSLLLIVAPAGQSNQAVTITISDGTTLTTDSETPVPYQFDAAGTFTVTGICAAPVASGSVTVTVVAATLESSVPVNSFRRDWVCTNLPQPVVLDADPRLITARMSRQEQSLLQPPLLPLGTNDRVYRINHAVFEPRYILARLGQNGPVLASAAVHGFQCAMPPESSLRLISTALDGTQSIEGTYVLTPAPTNITVSLKVATAGVTFDDGTLERTLEPSDFGDLGIYRAIYLRSPSLEASVCMKVDIYYNDSMRAAQ